MQARYLAWAGFHYALEQMREDIKNEESKVFDNLFACGVHLKQGQMPEDIFENRVLGLGSFQVTTQDFQHASLDTRFGLGDEDGKVNLNALNLQNYGILKELLIVLGLSEHEALRMAAAVVDWRDEDREPVLGRAQSQEGPYSWNQEKIPAKNRPFNHRFELMFIDGMTPELYQKIKDLVTVFPRQAQSLKINIATAPKEVVAALARNFAGPATHASLSDGESLAMKILNQRIGPDKIEATADDALISEKELRLTAPQANIFRAMTSVQTLTSRFLTVHVTGLVAAGQRKSHIDAVVDREILTVVSWKAD